MVYEGRMAKPEQHARRVDRERGRGRIDERDRSEKCGTSNNVEGVSASCKDHYPTPSSLTSSSRLHSIVNRSSIAGIDNPSELPRSRTIDFHDVLTDNHQRNNVEIEESDEQDSFVPSSSSPLSASSASPSNRCSPRCSHLDAADIAELEHILARERQRVVNIREGYDRIVEQKQREEEWEEKQRAERFKREREMQTKQAPTQSRLSASSAMTYPPPAASSVADAPTPASAATVTSTSSLPLTATAATHSAVESQPDAIVSHPASSSNVPSAPIVSGTPVSASTPVPITLPSPAAAPSQSASLSQSPPAPKLYKRVRKTTHAQARERARLKGNIDIRLIDYAQVVKMESGIERPIVGDPAQVEMEEEEEAGTGGDADEEHDSCSLGDPGLLIGVNNLIYFISNIVTQEVERILRQERWRQEAHQHHTNDNANAKQQTTDGDASAATTIPPSTSSSNGSTDGNGDGVESLSHSSSFSLHLESLVPSRSAAFQTTHVPRREENGQRRADDDEHAHDRHENEHGHEEEEDEHHDEGDNDHEHELDV